MSFLVHTAFAAAAHRRPDKVAIRYEGREISYAELEHQAGRLAAALRAAHTLCVGDRIGVFMANRPEYYVAVLAVARAGLTVVPVPAGARLRELHHFVQDSGMRVMLADGGVVERLGDDLTALVNSGVSVHVWDRDFAALPSLAGLIEQAPGSYTEPGIDDSMPFFIGYTSGTTGRPKGAMVSHRARTTLMLMMGQEYGCYTADDVNLVTTPLYHGAGLTRGLAPLVFGGTVELLPRFDPERVAAALSSGQITGTFMVPTMFAAMFESARPTRAWGEAPLTILSNASALPEHLKEEILTAWPRARLFEIYGSTEAGTVTSLRPADIRAKQRCVGQPLACTEVQLRGPDGSPVPPGEVGTLWSRSPFVFNGYLGQPEATERVLVDGFVGAGDLARMDDEGFVYIVGRDDDVINSGGVNIYPREIEEVLGAHPLVREVAVIGLPDDYWGQIVHAVIVRSPGEETDMEQALIAHCRRDLASQKVPRSFEFRDRLPRTASGKVRKRDLVHTATERQGP